MRKATQTDATLRRWYATYNRKFFGNKLPMGAQLDIQWSEWVDKEKTEAYVETPLGDPVVMRLNKTYLNGVCMSRIALLHEMVHIALIARGDANAQHGPKFEEETTRLKLAGAYKGLL